jgi:hypothetical protein
VLYLIWLAGVALVTTFVVLWFGPVEGEELNPHTLRRRHFSYYQVPGIRVQVSSISHDPVNGTGFETALSAMPFFKSSSQNEWHLVWASEARRPPERGDASIFTDYVHDTESQWRLWTKDNPKTAAKFWPVAIDLARRNHYLLLPDIMDLAAASSDSEVAEFPGRLNDSLVTQYIKAAGIQQELGQTSDVDELVEYANGYAKGVPKLQRLVRDFAN